TPSSTTATHTLITSCFIVSQRARVPPAGASEGITDLPTDVIPFIILPVEIRAAATAVGRIDQPAGNELREVVTGNSFRLQPLPPPHRPAEVRVEGKTQPQAVAGKAERPLDEKYRQQVPLIAHRAAEPVT